MNSADQRERDVPEYDTLMRAITAYREKLGGRSIGEARDAKRQVVLAYVDWFLAYERKNAEDGRPFNGRNHTTYLRKLGMSADGVDIIVEAIINELTQRVLEVEKAKGKRSRVRENIDDVIEGIRAASERF